MAETIEFVGRQTGSASIMVDAGQDIKIEINGEELLNVEVPEGKVWKTTISVQVIESNV